MSETKIGIVGCSGRMGRMLLAAVLESDRAALAGGVERPDSAFLGHDLGELAGQGNIGIPVSDDAADLFKGADVVIDFTTPAATRAHAELAAESGTALVVGTTGLDAEAQEAIAAAAKSAPIVQAPNMSLGVNLLLALVEEAAAKLPPEAYDIEVLEMHHRHKVDAPSGTALGLGAAAAKGRGVELEEAAVRVRDGHTGPREAGTIGFATLRGGDVAGDHSVIFAGDGERLELGHRASNRAVFAQGALTAALWAAGKTPGLYSMKDVLGL
jgi:4-hydroxy-tetrahydrodipicolinate reductase